MNIRFDFASNIDFLSSFVLYIYILYTVYIYSMYCIHIIYIYCIYKLCIYILYTYTVYVYPVSMGLGSYLTMRVGYPLFLLDFQMALSSLVAT